MVHLLNEKNDAIEVLDIQENCYEIHIFDHTRCLNIEYKHWLMMNFRFFFSFLPKQLTMPKNGQFMTIDTFITHSLIWFGNRQKKKSDSQRFWFYMLLNNMKTIHKCIRRSFAKRNWKPSVSAKIKKRQKRKKTKLIVMNDLR